ncbi:hypothetical protein [Nocardia camponoti]|uniref:PPE domain-containing protein n=1 Tax=Nocardia camponoti TaxID=1616106 RepID=A0A917QB32_9NOCA|nr:hypothetical protein [Nocardia camponoti]GGK40336.1 hypothetical protein GCM10011591_09980 [Nocardia camponoti]
MTYVAPQLPWQNLVPNITHGLANVIAGGEAENTPDANAVQTQYNKQRDTVRGQAGQLGYTGTYRPLEVLNTDEFSGSTAQLRAKVDKIDLQAVADLSAAWRKIQTDNTTSINEFQKMIAKGTSADVWSGAASAAAAKTVADYHVTGTRVSTAAALTGNKIDELRTGLEPTKQLVPHAPDHRSGLDNARSWIVGRGWRNDDVAEANSAAEARRVLKTVYAPVVHESDNQVPVIPKPESLVNNGGGNPGGGNPGGTGRPAGVPDNGQPSNPNAPGSPTNPGTPQNYSPSNGDDNGNDSDSPSDGTNPTTPQTTDPNATKPTGTTPAGTTPGGSPGSPGGTGPGGGSPAQTPGSSVPGTPGNPGGARPAAATAGGATSGRAGTPGMGMPGAGRGRGEDDERSRGIPDYLITQENSDELTGLGNLPSVVPPVIGE